MNILIIDYGSGNIKSVYNSINHVSETNSIKSKITISSSKYDIDQSDFILLPGVGSFKSCKKNILKHEKLIESICENVQIKQKPFLGICVGMQLLATLGYENGIEEGFNWIEGEVKHLKTIEEIKIKNLKIPHMGWNHISCVKKDSLFKGITETDQFYFVHSYYFNIKNNDNLLGYVEYGSRFPAVLKKNNIYGLQFHPEKSGNSGQKILLNWLSENEYIK